MGITLFCARCVAFLNTYSQKLISPTRHDVPGQGNNDVAITSQRQTKSFQLQRGNTLRSCGRPPVWSVGVLLLALFPFALSIFGGRHAPESAEIFRPERHTEHLQYGRRNQPLECILPEPGNQRPDLRHLSRACRRNERDSRRPSITI
jgi:hypothetical protein